MRLPVWRMAVLFQLDRQRASAFRTQWESDQPANVKQSGPAEAVPFDSRVLPNTAVAHELPILNEKDRADDNGRDLIESFELRAIDPGISQDSAVGGTDPQARGCRLVVGWINSPACQPDQPRRITR